MGYQDVSAGKVSVDDVQAGQELLFREKYVEETCDKVFIPEAVSLLTIPEAIWHPKRRTS